MNNKYIAIIDTGYFIKKELDIVSLSQGYIPLSVFEEIKDTDTQIYYNIMSLKITVRDPKPENVQIIKEHATNKHLNLSNTDIEVCALMKEISEEKEGMWISAENIDECRKVICLTTDNGIKLLLRQLNLYEDVNFKFKTFKLRCYACLKIFDTPVDFCTSCGYNTISRVTVVKKNNNKEAVYLKKNYKPKPRIIRDSKGKEIVSEDSKEYRKYLTQHKRFNK